MAAMSIIFVRINLTKFNFGKLTVMAKFIVCPNNSTVFRATALSANYVLAPLSGSLMPMLNRKTELNCDKVSRKLGDADDRQGALKSRRHQIKQHD